MCSPPYVPGVPGHPEADGPGLVGLKDYAAVAGRARFLVQLFSAEDGRLLALIEADLLGQMRTGGASGVATRYMARPDARIAGMIGAGGQARTQALAMCEARSSKNFWSRAFYRAGARASATALSAQTGVAFEPAKQPEQVAREADVIVTVTTAHDPVLLGAWLQPGQHINVMGSNWAHRREVDGEAVRRSAVVAVDARDQALIEAGDLLLAEQSGDFTMDDAVELCQIVAWHGGVAVRMRQRSRSSSRLASGLKMWRSRVGSMRRRANVAWGRRSSCSRSSHMTNWRESGIGA